MTDRFRDPAIPQELRRQDGTCQRCYEELQPKFLFHGVLYPIARTLLWVKHMRVMNRQDYCPVATCQCGRRAPKKTKLSQETLFDLDVVAPKKDQEKSYG